MSDMGDIEDLLKQDPREPFKDEPEFPQDEDEPIVLCWGCSKEWPKSVAAPWNPSGAIEVTECPACTCFECGSLLKEGHTRWCKGVD